MGWKLWTVAVFMGLSLLLNIKDVWSPKAKYRDEDETRKISLISIFIITFFLYAILEASYAN
jgi:hypothetical protein